MKTAKGFGTLTALQKRFMGILANLPDQDQFYLAGGTALSEYYLGHRLSFDLDYFTGVEHLAIPMSYQIENACQNASIVSATCFEKTISCVGYGINQKDDPQIGSSFCDL